MQEKLKKIKLILTDVDGVLTRGEIFFDAQGNELKTWNVRDGLALSIARRLDDIDVGFITGRQSKSVEFRATELKVKYLMQGCMDKRKAYADLKEQSGLNDEEIAYIGDDLIDLPILTQVGFAMCPKDAVEEVKAVVDVVSKVDGGCGVFREALKLVLVAQGRWDGIEKVFQK